MRRVVALSDMDREALDVIDLDDFAALYMAEQVARTRWLWLRSMRQRKPVETVFAAYVAYQEAKQAAQEIKP
jgi:hypothetical protein